MYYAVFAQESGAHHVAATSWDELATVIGLQEDNHHYKRALDELLRTHRSEWGWYDLYRADNLKLALDLKKGNYIDLETLGVSNLERYYKSNFAVVESYDSKTEVLRIEGDDREYEVHPHEWVPIYGGE